MKNYVLFWIKSSKGTNEVTVRCVPTKNKDDIKTLLEIWCQNFTCWTSGGLVSYGWKPIKKPDRKTLLKQWKIICDRKAKVEERYKIIRSLLALKR
jgi:hypothetical protein